MIISITKSLILWLSFISSFSTLFPLFIYFIVPKKIKRENKLILFLVFSAILIELLIFILPFFQINENIMGFNIYFVFEIALISSYYYWVTSNKYLKYIILVCSSILGVLALLHLFGEQKHKLNNVYLSIQSIQIIIFSLFNFFEQLKKMEHPNILSVPRFWINSAFLIFFGGNLFLHTFSNYLLEHELYSFFELWGIIHSSLNIAFYVLISVAFWKTRKY